MTKPKSTVSGSPPEDEHWDTGAPAPKDPQTGQHRDHWVLTPEELAKGRVRPMRLSYRHVGRKPPETLRDLDPEELERYKPYGYVKHEPYPENESCLTGRFWTQEQLDQLGGCGASTTMPQLVAETWATDPSFYGATFCVSCREYLPVEEFVWEGTQERLGS